MFHSLISHFKAKLSLAAQSAACGLIAALAAIVAIGFFAAAGFVWLSDRYGAINACLMFGAAFVLIAVVAAIVLAVLRRRPPPPPLKSEFAQAFKDPKLLAIGLEIARTFGGRRAASAGLIGAFIVGALLSRGVPKK